MGQAIYRGFDMKALEKQYTPREQVPEYENYFINWATRSKNYRDRSNCHLDIAYGHSALETLDLFLPKNPSGAIHVFIHGGYWRFLDKGEYSYLCEPLVSAGAVVATLNYGLCPRVNLETIVEQTKEALVWLYHNAANYKGDPSRLHVSGHSAGGHLAAMLLAMDWTTHDKNLPKDLIKSVTAISGIYDLAPLIFVSANEDLRLSDKLVQRLSPINLKPAYDAALNVFVGAGESSEFIRQSKEFSTVWGNQLTSQNYTELPDLNHFTILDQMRYSDHPITKRMIAILG